MNAPNPKKTATTTSAHHTSSPGAPKGQRPGLHGFAFRSEETVPLGTTVPSGRFGRMLSRRELTPNTPEALQALAKTLVDPKPDGDDTRLDLAPAGYTYLGQFIDHDVTFDPTPVPEQWVDPAGLHNFRTPALDLDSLYGIGRKGSPHLYDQRDPDKLLVDLERRPQTPRNDLPRNSQGVALLGDPRNDENLIVAQLHLAFLHFHNAMVEHLRTTAVPAPSFEEIRRLVTWHYQWIILYDYLETLLLPNSVKEALEREPILRFTGDPFIPVEFSVAAFRFGHSMVRAGYGYNTDTDFISLVSLLFRTGPSRSRSLPGGGIETSVPLPLGLAIDWRRFFRVRHTGDAPRLNKSRPIDPLLTLDLHNLAQHGNVTEGPSSLAVRNLLRGRNIELPSGQLALAQLKIPARITADLPVLTTERIAEELKQQRVPAEFVPELSQTTPLWYYLLLEAKVQTGGLRLGALGSTIVAETFVRLLQSDPTSFLHVNPTWKPAPPVARAPGKFEMADLLEFADQRFPVINASEDPRSTAA